MRDEADTNAIDLQSVDGRDPASDDVDGTTLDVISDDENDTVTFVAADADAQDRTTAWLTVESSAVVHVTQMQ
jgi:hypothetical protein